MKRGREVADGEGSQFGSGGSREGERALLNREIDDGR